jgi:hypothetical protein
MNNLFLEHDLVELHAAQRSEQIRAREFRGAFSFALFTFPATAFIAIICANYDGPERAGLLVMMFSACTFTMSIALWAARDTWRALRDVRWRIEILLDNVNETI